MAITPTYAYVEMADGTQHAQRVLLADKLQLERTSKVRQWDSEKDAITTNVFMAWAALKRTGLYKDTYEAFIGGDCADIFLTTDKPADEPEDDDPLNPTQPAMQND